MRRSKNQRNNRKTQVANVNSKTKMFWKGSTQLQCFRLKELKFLCYADEHKQHNFEISLSSSRSLTLSLSLFLILGFLRSG